MGRGSKEVTEALQANAKRDKAASLKKSEQPLFFVVTKRENVLGEGYVSFATSPEQAYKEHVEDVAVQADESVVDGDEVHLYEVKYIGTIKSKHVFDIKKV